MDSVQIQMRNILDEYNKEVQETANSVMETVSGQATIIVHNSKFAYLTHLLNNGHIIRNKYGTYGRKNGDNHIGKVEQWANQEVESEIERKL